MIERYQTAEMNQLWSERAVLSRWTEVELKVCEVWHERGEISATEIAQIRTRAKVPSPDRVREIEATTRHDVVAFTRALGESIGEPASRHVHRGLTSSDVLDTALAMGMRDSLSVVIAACDQLRIAISRRALELKDVWCVGRTHGVHAEPTTYGLRLAGWHAELMRHLARLQTSRTEISFGKMSGAIGTFSQTDPAFEAAVLAKLGLTPEPVATQVVPRDRHAYVLSTLALLGAGLERFATDIRHLQRTEVREVEEPFAPGQTGSSAMPHKRNPVVTERVCGMARLLRSYSVAALEDVSLWHERDISHSSVERVIVPDAFHLAHTMLTDMTTIISGLRVDAKAMAQNLERTGGLLFSQSVLSALLKKGLARELAYRLVQSAAMRVWEGEVADLRTGLSQQKEIAATLSTAELEAAFSRRPHVEHLPELLRRAGIEEA